MSYQKKGGRGHARPSFFWHDNDSGYEGPFCVTQVMCTIDEALTNLDDMDYVIDLLRKIGRTHTRFENYKPEIFWVREKQYIHN